MKITKKLTIEEQAAMMSRQWEKPLVPAREDGEGVDVARGHILITGSAVCINAADSTDPAFKPKKTRKTRRG